MHHIVLSRRVSQLACIRRYASAIEGQNLPRNSVSSDGISPPPRIRRGPTDILQALASTVGPDPTAAHYKYHDDPYLIPLSNYRKRAYALSAEAGRKAAAWIRDEHAELFTTREWDPPGKAKTPYFNAEPIIEAYAPKPFYNNESKVTEDDLRYTIKNALLEDSVKVFQLLGGNEGISEELKMDLLQLLCFYNEKEPETAEWLEERWFASNTNVRHSTTWKLGGLADKIFTSLEPKTSKAYCAIIQGMAKYYQAERAYALTQEAVENGIQLSTDVYNSLIGCIGFLKEGTALRTEELKSLLNEINIRGLSPNEATLTSCLRSISFWGGGRQLHQLTLQVLAEFTELGFKPSLSDYYYLLCIFCKENGPPIDILTTILNDLESRDKLVAKEATDTNFFITAMGVCSDHLQNIELAQRLNALLMKGDNYKLVGDAYKESIYYRHYTTVTCRFASFDKAMEVLDTLVPNVYIPEPSVIREIIKTLEVNGAGERLAQTASQLVVFGHARRSMLVDRLLEAMCNCFHYQDDEVKGKMRSAAIELLNFGQVDTTLDTRTPVQKMSAVALSAIIEVCASCEDVASASWTAVSDAVGQLRAGDATGVPQRPQTLADVAARAASLGLHQLAADIVWYLSECGFEVEARSASETALSAALGRPVAEVSELLQRPRDSLTASLLPSALQIYDAYQMATSSPQTSSNREVSSSSSESDGESSSDDDK